MATPIFKPLQGHVAQVHPVPRALETALFVHRIKQQFKPHKDPALHANGHPIIHQPIVVRAAKPAHTSSTRLY